MAASAMAWNANIQRGENDKPVDPLSLMPHDLVPRKLRRRDTTKGEPLTGESAGFLGRMFAARKNQ